MVVMRLGMNTYGRDFVAGDVHGAMDSLEEALAKVFFDTFNDRLFLVGDLGSRGRRCLEAYALLKRPYVHAVRGNHEDMFLEAYGEGGERGIEAVRTLAAINWNGMGWLGELSEEDMAECASLARALPIAMEIETHRGNVGIVHADVPFAMHWGEFLAKLESGDQEVIKTALWGRERVQLGRKDGVPGIDRLFVGHTPQFDGMCRLANVYALDSGAVFGELGRGEGHISLVNATAATVVLSALPKNLREADTRGAFDQSEHQFSPLEDLIEFSPPR